MPKYAEEDLGSVGSKDFPLYLLRHSGQLTLTLAL